MTGNARRPGERPTKLARLRDHMAAGEWDAALALAARFPRLGDHATANAIRRGHEAAARPEFYRQLGQDPKALRAAGIAALRERYGEVEAAASRGRSGPGAATGTRRPQVSIRVDAETWAALGALAARLPVGRAALAREVMRLGVERLKRDGAAALLRPEGTRRRATPGA